MRQTMTIHSGLTPQDRDPQTLLDRIAAANQSGERTLIWRGKNESSPSFQLGQTPLQSDKENDVSKLTLRTREKNGDSPLLQGTLEVETENQATGRKVKQHRVNAEAAQTGVIFPGEREELLGRGSLVMLYYTPYSKAPTVETATDLRVEESAVVLTIPIVTFDITPG